MWSFVTSFVTCRRKKEAAKPYESRHCGLRAVSHNVSHDLSQAIDIGDRRSSITALFPAFDVVLERHAGSGMSGCGLCLFDVLGGIVDVGEHCGAESAGRDTLRELNVCADSSAHIPHKLIALHALATDDELIGCPRDHECFQLR